MYRRLAIGSLSLALVAAGAAFAQGSPQEGAVVKGTVVGIEKDLAVIDVGAKTEGRVALREFAQALPAYASARP